MKPKTLIGLALMAGFATLLLMNFGQSVSPYTHFAQAEEQGVYGHVIGNWVPDRPVQYDRDTNEFTFYMRDEEGTIRQVRYNNPRPENFEEAEQLVIEGRAEGDGFRADRILVKCPSKYNDDRALQQTQTASSP